MEKYLETGDAPSAEVLRKCLRKGTIACRFQSGAVRLFLQEQGRAAGAGRRRRLSPGPDGRRSHQDGGRGR